MDPNSPPGRDVNQSSLLMLRLLEEIGARQPVTLGELATAVDRPKTTVHRVLSTLHHADWIRPTAAERTTWVLTSRVVRVARAAGDHEGLRDLAHPVLRGLRDRTAESVLLATSDDRYWTVVDFVEGKRAIRLVADNVVGVRFPMHAGASGKAILATWSAGALDRYIMRGLESVSPGTLHDATALRSELARARKRGYAESRGETVDDDDSAGVAAAIVGRDKVAEASIAIGLPGHRLDNATTRRTLVAAVCEAAAELNERLRVG